MIKAAFSMCEQNQTNKTPTPFARAFFIDYGFTVCHQA
jgi:hypothetical protein